MIIREEIDVTRELSEEERAMLRRAMEMPITYDDESPTLSQGSCQSKITWQRIHIRSQPNA